MKTRSSQTIKLFPGDLQAGPMSLTAAIQSQVHVTRTAIDVGWSVHRSRPNNRIGSKHQQTPHSHDEVCLSHTFTPETTTTTSLPTFIIQTQWLYVHALQNEGGIGN